PLFPGKPPSNRPVVLEGPSPPIEYFCHATRQRARPSNNLRCRVRISWCRPQVSGPLIFDTLFVHLFPDRLTQITAHRRTPRLHVDFPTGETGLPIATSLYPPLG